MKRKILSNIFLKFYIQQSEIIFLKKFSNFFYVHDITFSTSLHVPKFLYLGTVVAHHLKLRKSSYYYYQN